MGGPTPGEASWTPEVPLEIADQLAHALRSPRPFEDLLRVLAGLAAGGTPQQDAYRACEELLVEVRARMGPGEEAALLGVMDVVCGFCPPAERLFPGELPRLHRDAAAEPV